MCSRALRTASPPARVPRHSLPLSTRGTLRYSHSDVPMHDGAVLPQRGRLPEQHTSHRSVIASDATAANRDTAEGARYLLKWHVGDVPEGAHDLPSAACLRRTAAPSQLRRPLRRAFLARRLVDRCGASAAAAAPPVLPSVPACSVEPTPHSPLRRSAPGMAWHGMAAQRLCAKADPEQPISAARATRHKPSSGRPTRHSCVVCRRVASCRHALCARLAALPTAALQLLRRRRRSRRRRTMPRSCGRSSTTSRRARSFAPSAPQTKQASRGADVGGGCLFPAGLRRARRVLANGADPGAHHRRATAPARDERAIRAADSRSSEP